jgi:hypothetical protein
MILRSQSLTICALARLAHSLSSLQAIFELIVDFTAVGEQCAPILSFCKTPQIKAVGRDDKGIQPAF